MLRNGYRQISISHYNKALTLVKIKKSNFVKIESETRELMIEIQLRGGLNLIHTMLQLEDWKKAKTHGELLLKTHPDNPKLLYRLAKANLGLKLYDKALGYIKHSIQLEPKN